MATSLTQLPQLSGQDVNTSSAVQQMPIGAYAETSDGRGFRYSLVGAVSTVPGKIYSGPAMDSTNYTPAGGIGVSAAAIGATQVTLTTSLTIAANALAGGYLVTDVTPGQGYIYRIVGNTAVSGATGCVITLADPIVVALTTSSKVILQPHPYSGIVVSPASALANLPVGVASSIITNAQYGWLQTYGPAAVLSGVATSVSTPGVPVTPSAATAGSTIVATAVLPTIGWAMHLFTATEYQAIYLTIH